MVFSVHEARFQNISAVSAPVQTGPGAHPASYTMGTRSFWGVKRLGLGIDHPPPSSAEVKERLERYFSSPSEPSWSVNFTFTLTLLFIAVCHNSMIYVVTSMADCCSCESFKYISLVSDVYVCYFFHV